MPELPEVETIRRGLEPHIVGIRIEDVVVGDPHVLQLDVGSFAARIRRQQVTRLRRRGKKLLIELETDCLVVHLGMTGQLTFRDPRREDAARFVRHETTGLQRAHQHAPDKHTHVQFLFGDGTSMLYRDIRKFGKIYLLSKDGPELTAHLSRLGLEPFSDSYSWDGFRKRFGNRGLRIKSLLLDQGFVAGVGNIYADEALFEAGIHPERRADKLRPVDRRRLFRAIPAVLERGIQFGGTSLRDYVNSEGEQGSNQEELMVYGRAGEPCLRCNATILRIVVSQRGTHYCPRCQRPAPRKRKK